MSMLCPTLSNQLCTTKQRHRRSRKWYVSGVFLQSIDWCAANAFIIWTDFNQEKTFPNRSVKRCLADELKRFALGLAKQTIPDEPTAPLALALPFDKSYIPPQHLVGLVHLWRHDKQLGHYTGITSLHRLCQAHRQKKQVQSFCTMCGVFLCVEDGCFIQFHELDDYLYDDPKLSSHPFISHKRHYL